MITLRIAPDGVVRGLWTDEIDWANLGRLSVRRASHVEFCKRRQRWYVRSARPRGWLRCVVQWVTGRPCGELLYTAPTREAALAWEARHYAPGGLGWESLTGSAEPSEIVA